MRARFCVATWVQVSVAGSNSSATRTGISSPGVITSSRSAPEVVSTWPFGSCVPDPYQRGALSDPVTFDEYFGVGPDRSIVSTRDSAVAT